MTTIIICAYLAIGTAAGAYAANEMKTIVKTAPSGFKFGITFGAAMTTLAIILLWPIFAIGVGIIYAGLRKKAQRKKDSK